MAGQALSHGQPPRPLPMEDASPKLHLMHGIAPALGERPMAASCTGVCPENRLLTGFHDNTVTKAGRKL